MWKSRLETAVLTLSGISVSDVTVDDFLLA